MRFSVVWRTFKMKSGKEGGLIKVESGWIQISFVKACHFVFAHIVLFDRILNGKQM